MQRLSRLSFLGVLTFILSSCGSQDTTENKDTTPPNIIIIAANDLGLSHIGTYGGTIATPHLDRLAQGGVKFTSAYAASPNSGPSRAALLTGRYPVRFGFEYENLPSSRAQSEGLGLDLDETTVASLLKGAGYSTHAVGVWQMGLLREHYPMLRGFDSFYGTRDGHTAELRPSSPHLIHAPSSDYPISPSRNRRNAIMTGMPPKQVFNDEELLTDGLASRAGEIIREEAAKTPDQSTPFFLYVGLNAPHTPLITIDKYYARFSHLDDHQERVYAAMVAATDDAVGHILDTLDAVGLAENTLIAFTSVSGCDPASGQCHCDTIKGTKGGLYEGGLKMPLLMRWPQQFEAGQVFDKQMSLMDIAATAVSVDGNGGRDGIFFDGVDLRPFLNGSSDQAPHKVLYWASRPMFGALEEQFKLIYDDSGQLPAMLFNLEKDPLESENLAARRLDKVLELRSRIDPWRPEISPAAWQPTSIEEVTMCESPMLVAR